MMSKLLCCFLFALLLLPATAQATPTAAEMIKLIVARDKQLQQRRKSYDYDIDITREKLDSDKAVVSKEKEHLVVKGDHRPDYDTRGAMGNPDQEAKRTSEEEPFELLKIIDHFTYSLKGEEMADGVLCYKIQFTAKPDQPYHNREEKVLNEVTGYLWASKADYSLIKNEGSLMHPVSVAWVFATLTEMEFHFDSAPLPNGDYGPKQVQYRYRVEIPLFLLHERDTRLMTNYRSHS